MTAQHADPEYRKNSRIIRQQVAAKRRAGAEVICWRCGHPIEPEQTYDVGHITPHGGHSITNLAAEHRYRIPGVCRGNRGHGGALGRAIQAGRVPRTTPTPPRGLLPW